MNKVRNDQLDLNLVGTCLDNMLQILPKSLLCFTKIWKIDDYSKNSNLMSKSKEGSDLAFAILRNHKIAKSQNSEINQ